MPFLTPNQQRQSTDSTVVAALTAKGSIAAAISQTRLRTLTTWCSNWYIIKTAYEYLRMHYNATNFCYAHFECSSFNNSIKHSEKSCRLKRFPFVCTIGH